MELFLQLAKPNKEGFSRWVFVSEFVNSFSSLQLGNGGSWCRANSSLAKRFILQFDRTKTKGNSIDAIKLNGFNKKKIFNQSIRSDIKEYFKNSKCVMLGVSGNSENTIIEIDHKNSRKNDDRISNILFQKIEDFQPLCKAANDMKRQICKRCKETNLRWSAKNILGNPFDFYIGNENYDEKLGCEGCYQFDPVKYRKETIKRITKEVTEFITKKFLNNE